MPDRLDIEVTGFEFLTKLDRAAAQLERPAELMQQIGATLEANIRLRFVTKTDPRGDAWLPLKSSTLQRKKGLGSILLHTGIGERSLRHEATASTVEVGFSEFYMQYHETGTRYMPRRQLLADDFVAGTLGAQDQADVLADVESFLNGLGLA